MFRKLKEKIVENSPQRLQFSQLVGDTNKSSPPVPEDSFFSISEDDANTSSANVESGYTSVTLMSPQETRHRRNSNTSVASDVSFLPRYESSLNMYQLQSDLDISASELEDNVSSSSQIGHLSKEQIHSAFQKSQMRYHKYRGRYTDLARHYKELERENFKMKSVLVETQDKAIRRVIELKEQCALEQKAKAHLEGALRDELDEKQLKIESLQTKIKLLQSGTSANSGEGDNFSSETNGDAKNTSLQKTTEDMENLKKYLTDARVEIEKLNEKLQEVKANNIILNSKEQDYKSKIAKLEKDIAQFSEREKENNLKLAQSKMELHNELVSKESELNNLKKDNETLKQNLEALETNNIKNLQAQNKKLIEKIESLNEKYSNYEGELLKVEQYKIEIKTLHESVAELRKKNEEMLQNTELADSQKKVRSLIAQHQQLQETVNELNNDKGKLEADRMNLKEGYENQIAEIRDNAKKGLLSLEEKMREKLSQEFAAKEEEMKTVFQQKVDSLTSSESASKEAHLKLMESEQLVKELTAKLHELQNSLEAKENKYSALETDHLELINEGNDLRNKLSGYEKELTQLKIELKSKDDKLSKLENQIAVLEDEQSSSKSYSEALQKDYQTVQDERLALIEDNATLKDQMRLSEEKLDCADLQNTENELLSLKVKNLHEENKKLLENLNLEQKDREKILKEISKLKQYEEKADNFEKVISEKEYELSKLNDSSNQIEKENNDLKTEVQNLQRSIREHEEIIAGLKVKEETLSVNSKECSIFEMKIQKLEEEKADIRKSFDQQKILFDAEKEQFLKEILGYKDSLESLQKSHAEQKEKCEKLERELEQFGLKQEESRKAYEEKINYIQIEKDELKKENENLQISLDETKSRVNEYQNNSTDQQKNYETKIDNLIKENRKAKTILKKDREHIEVLNKDLEQKTEQLQRVTTEHMEIQNLCKKHEGQVKELESLLSAKETESIAQIKKEKEYQNELIHKLQELENRVVEKSSACEKLKEKILDLEKRYNEEKQRFEQQIERLKESESLYSNMAADNLLLKEEISRLQKLEEYVASLEKQKTEYLSELELLRNNIKQLETEKGSHEQEANKFKEIQDKCNELEKEKITLEQKLSDLRLCNKENENLSTELSKLKLIEEAKSRLEEDLSSLSKDHNNVMERNKELQKQIVNYKLIEAELHESVTKVTELTNQVSSLQLDISKMSNEKAALEAEVIELNNEKSSLADSTDSHVSKLRELSRENKTLEENCEKLHEEISQLKVNNNHLTTDNKHVIEENTNLLLELEAAKLKTEMLADSSSQAIASSNKLQLKNEDLESKIVHLQNEIDSLKNNQSESGPINHLKEDSDELSKIQHDFYQMKHTCDNLVIENKTLKTDLSKLEERCDAFAKVKKQYESQITELEKQYNELMNEKQLLQDDIQELKISPINLHNSSGNGDRLDDLEIMKKADELSGENGNGEKYQQEIDALREKVTKYKSLDLTNKSSIEFYENELQKLKIKNEKLNRKLDETLVTLGHCAELSHSTEIEYLRNVLYNYMLGKEGLVLARVIAAVCKFDPEQTETVLQKEQQKQSLLGSLGIL